jgi:hypothetical protein
MSNRISALRGGIKKVTTAGTAVALADTTTAPLTIPLSVTIQALGTNTNPVVVGASNVVAAPGTQGTPTQVGIRLAANDTITIDITDITQVWVDSITSGDGVSWLVGSA